MKRLIIITFLAAIGTVSFAQDTAYISREKTTALFFQSPVKVLGKIPDEVNVVQKGNGLITLKAVTTGFSPVRLTVQEVSTARIIRIPVNYSYGRAGRRMEIGDNKQLPMKVIKTPETSYNNIAVQLASGKRDDVVDHKKTGGINAWINKLSLAGNRVFFRLDIRNQSNLPYDVDFIRFYIRDLKTVARMATHEQEIVPVYSSLHKRTSIVKKQEIAWIFAFHRFSLSGDQALNVELYERNGNRHLNLQIKQKDLEELKIIHMSMQQTESIAAQNL